jgi:tetratricopeptide (TPR) repeat protein
MLWNRPEPFVLKVSDDCASIPWEGFQLYLDPANREKFAPLRLVGGTSPWAFASPATRLTILNLIGDSGPGHEYDPVRAREMFTSIFAGLDAATKTRVADPTTIIVGEDGLDAAAAVAKSVRPNVVVFFGHGRIASGPELRCGPGADGWIALADLVDRLFAPDDTKPIYWVFWACSLAEDSAQPDLHLDGPEIFKVLTSRGAVSVLAMRSRIRVPFARVMLRALVQALAAGEPLEIAAALARTAACAMDAAIQSGGQMDFAAPAVWSVSEPVDAITWGTEPPFPAVWTSRPLLAGIHGKFDELGSGVAQLSEWAESSAAAWSQERKLFLHAPVAAASDAMATFDARFLELASAVRNLTGKAVIPIQLELGLNFDRKLMAWAAEAHRHLDPRHSNRELAVAIGHMSRSGSFGLQRLLAVPDVCVMLSEPPDRDDIWRLFDSLDESVSVFVVGSSVPDDLGGWSTDQWSEVAMPESLEEGGLDGWPSKVREAAAMLAVLERPVTMEEVARTVKTDRPALSTVESLTIPVGSRRVIGQRARQKILRDAPDELMKLGHQLCIDLLSSRSPDADFGALIEFLGHQLALGLKAEAAALANEAFQSGGAAWSVFQLGQVAAMASSSAGFLDGLSDGLLLGLGRAFVALQETSLARAILETKRPAGLADQASYHAILSEIYKADKSSGQARARMRQHAQKAAELIDRAIKEAPGDEALQRDALAYDHNLARISQYFDHAYDAALTVYENIIAQLEEVRLVDRPAGHLYAAACRNAAECVFDPAARPLTPELLERAQAFVHRGLEVGNHLELTEVVAEITYTRARLSEAAGDNAASIQMLQRVLDTPQIDRFPIIATLSRNRQFWRRVECGDQPFSLEDLQPTLRALDILSWHAWPARAAVRSRLRAAKRLVASGSAANRTLARQLLEHSSRTTMSANGPSSGTDRLRWAQVFAGLHVLAPEAQPDPWIEFRALPWATAWLHETNEPTPEQIWNEVD